MNIVPGRYNADKLRYGKLAICSDADSDGYHIGLLIMSALYYLAPQFIEEGRFCWLRSPLYIVSNKGQESYYFTDEEFNQVRGKIKGEVIRNKGLGQLSPDQAHRSMFTPEFQRLDILKPDVGCYELLNDLMGPRPEVRADYIFEHLDFSTIRE